MEQEDQKENIERITRKIIVEIKFFITSFFLPLLITAFLRTDLELALYIQVSMIPYMVLGIIGNFTITLGKF